MPSIHRRRSRTIKAPLGTQPERSKSLTKGLVAAYVMNEGAGSTLYDLSGYRNTATLSDFTWGAGPFGNSLVTNNSNSYGQVTVPNGASLDITGNGITWGGWCYPTASNVYQCIQGKILNSTSRQYASYLSGNGTGQIYAALNGVTGLGNAGNNFLISTPWVVNAWNHIICTYDGATFIIYLNGRSVYSSAQSGSITNANTTNWYLGYEPTSATFPFNGKLDIQVVYNRSLAPSEVFRLYSEPLALFAPPATRRYYSFGSGISLSGSCTISGRGVLGGTGVLGTVGSAAISGSGGLQASGVQNIVGIASISATGLLGASGTLAISGGAQITGSGFLSATGSTGGAFSSTNFDFGLQSYLSSQLNQPVYPMHIPQSVSLPGYSCQRLGTDHTYAINGSSTLCNARYQIAAWSQRYDDVVSMSETLRGALQGFSGSMGSIRVQGVTLGNQVDSYDPPVDGSDNGSYGRINEFSIWYQQTYPSF